MRNHLTSFIAAGLLSACVTAADRAGPLGKTLADAGTEKSHIEYRSSNPITPRDFLDGLDNDRGVNVFGDLEFPEEFDGRIPAMIIVHASDGPKYVRGGVYAERFRDLGIATFRINSFDPRGVITTIGNQRAVSEWSMVADAYRVLALLATHPAIDPEFIGIIGWSKGGQTAYLTAFEPVRRAARVGELRFAVHFPFYRGCLQEVRMPMTGVPMREHIGALDDYTGTKRCVSEAHSKRAAGNDVEIRLYSGAYHGFDSGRPSVVHCARCWNVTKCHLILHGDGRQELGIGQTFDQCITRGTTVGGNEEARAAAMNSVFATLTEVFGL